jgi:hypothetical protein
MRGGHGSPIADGDRLKPSGIPHDPVLPPWQHRFPWPANTFRGQAGYWQSGQGSSPEPITGGGLSPGAASQQARALFNLRLAFRVMGHDVAVWLIPDEASDSSLLASVEIVTGRTHRPTVK